MPDVFISYSRKNAAFVKQLITALEAEGKSVWWDQKREAVEGILVGSPWWEQIKHGIETADNFLFIISPDSIVSPYCHAEINHARQYGKRLVTALYCSWVSEEDTWKAIGAALDAIPAADELPDEVSGKPVNFRSLARQNWLSLNEIQHAIFSSSKAFEEPFKLLEKALDEDFAWVKIYSRLRQAAQLWDENGRSDDYLWSHGQLKSVQEMIERRKLELDPLLQEFIKPEQERLLHELKNLNTTHQRRLIIGHRLATIGDTRAGVGVKVVKVSGRTVVVPEIDWCPVAPGGEITIEDQVLPVQPFSIARYLITHQQFQVFVGNWDVYNDERWWVGMSEHHNQILNDARNQFPNAPRDSVTWYQAVAFCRWLDRLYTQLDWKADPRLQIRLPTEWEWQWAAQNGKAAREYPWDAWDDMPRANTRNAGISNQSVAVGMYPDGAAACGALDMAGNLWEWSLNDYDNIAQIDPDYYGQHKALRGGSFDYFEDSAAAAYRGDLNPDDTYYDVGFRVVMGFPIPAT